MSSSRDAPIAPGPVASAAQEPERSVFRSRVAEEPPYGARMTGVADSDQTGCRWASRRVWEAGESVSRGPDFSRAKGGGGGVCSRCSRRPGFVTAPLSTARHLLAAYKQTLETAELITGIFRCSRYFTSTSLAAEPSFDYYV